MTVEPLHADSHTIHSYFDAMREGAAGEQALMALFTEDAVYIEPFSGQPQTHEGLSAIRAYFKASWPTSPPNLTLTVHRIDVDGAQLCARWTCNSPVFPAPVSGKDRYTLRDGRIARLEVTLD